PRAFSAGSACKRNPEHSGRPARKHTLFFARLRQGRSRAVVFDPVRPAAFARAPGLINLPPHHPAVRRGCAIRHTTVVQASLLKVMSGLLFAVMATLVRFLGERYPVGQIVFFRSAFAILPVVLIYAWRNELAAAVRTARPLGHVGRGLISIGGMFC